MASASSFPPDDSQEAVVLNFRARIGKDARGRFKASAHDFPGVVAYGDSREDAQSALEGAILKHLAAASTVALESVHEEPMGTIPYAGLSTGDRLYLATNLDVVLVTASGRRGDWKRVPVTQQQETDFFQVFEGEQSEDIFQPGEYTTLIYSLARFTPPEANAAIYAGTNLKGLVYVDDTEEGWRPAFSTGEDRVHALTSFREHLYAGTSSRGRLFRWNGQQADVVHQLSSEAEGTAVTALAVHNDALYAGTYPEGLILRSEDGELWEVACRTKQKMVNQLASLQGVLYAACSAPSGGAIFRSADGSSWDNCFSSPKDANVYAVTFFGGRLYAGTGDGGRLYASRDGAHWEVVVQSAEASLRVVIPHNGRLYVGCERRGIVYRTAGTEAPTPTIRDVEVASLTSSHAYLEWSTDQPCEAIVQYGEGPVRDRTVTNATLSRRHRLALDGLKAGTRYSFLITARSGEGAQAVYLNEDGFTTPVLPTPAIESSSHPEEERWYSTREIAMTWKPVPGAEKYLCRVSQQRITHLTERDKPTAEPVLSAPVDADGVWYAAVAAVDGAGNVGEVSVRGFRCDTAAAVPSVTSSTHPDPGRWYSAPVVELRGEGEDQASGVDGFSFAIGRMGEAWEQLVFQRAAGATWSLPRLPDGVWEIYVRMRDKAGNESSPTSLRVQVDTTPPIVALDPLPSIAKAGELELSWRASDERSGIGKVTVQQRREAGSGASSWETVYEGRGTGVKVQGEDGTRMWYRVVAEDRTGLKAAAESHHAVMFDGTPPDPVTSLEVKSQPGGDVLLRWAAVKDAHGEVGRYHVYRGSTADTLGMKIASVPPDILEYVDEGTGLAHGSRYHYRVGSEDAVGNAQTDGKTASGVCDKEAPVPRLSSETHPPDQWMAMTEAEVDWDTPADDTGVKEFLWRLDRNPASSLIRGVDATLPGPPLKLSRLRDGLWYVHVSSVDGAGNVSPSAHYALRIVTRPPHARLKPLPATLNTKNIKLEWELEDGVVAVAIGVREGGAQSWSVLEERAEGGGREVRVEGEGVYEFSIRALDTYGRTGIWEEGQVALIDVTPPLEIPVVEAVSQPGGAIRVQWDPSWDELSGLAAYRVYRTAAAGGATEAVAEIKATEECVFIDPCQGVEDGTRFIYTVWPVDLAGNMLESGPTAEAACDRYAPVPRLVAKSHPDPAKSYASRRLEMVWEADKDPSGVAGVVVELDASPATVPNPETLPLRKDRNLTFDLKEDGRWYVHARTVDGSGNASETVHFSVRVDTHVDPPNVSFPQDPFMEWAESGTVTASVKPPEDPSGVPAFWYVLDQNPETVPDRLNAARQPGQTLKARPKNEGVWYLHVAAEDGAGNISSPVHVNLRLSRGLPLLHIMKSSHPEGLWSQSRDVEIAWDPVEGERIGYLYWLVDRRSEEPPESAMRLERAECRFRIDEGAWFLHVCAVDERGRKSPAVAYQLRVDATAPSLAVFSPSHPKGRWSSSSRVQYAIEVDDAHSGVARVELALTASGETPAVWELALGTEGEREVPGEGLWTLWARAVDQAGNVSELSSWEIQVDLSASPPGINSYTHPSGQWSMDRVAELLLQPGEDPSGVAWYGVYVAPPSEETPAEPPPDTAWSEEETVSVELPGDGRWNIFAWAKDQAGNLSEPSRYAVLVDSAAGMPTGFVVEPTGEGGWIRSSEIQVYWKPPEEISGDPNGYLYVLDQEALTVPEPGSSGFSAQPELDLGDLADGIQYLHVRTVDAAGVLGEDAAHVKVEIDWTPPVLELECTDAKGDAWITSRQLLVRAKGEDLVSGFVGCLWTLHRDGEEPPPILKGRWKEEPEWTVEIQEDGVWLITVAAMDGAGNVSEPRTVRARIDSIALPPANVASPTHPDSGKWYGAREARLVWDEPVEASGVKGYRYAVAPSAAELGDPATWTRTASGPPLDVTVPEDGRWVVGVAAEDGAGNVSAVVRRGVWVDSSVAPPKLSSPSHPKPTAWYADTSVELAVSAEDSVSGIHEILVGASDNETPKDSAMRPVSGGKVTLTLERGRWWVHAVAVDRAGNRSAPASIKVQVDPGMVPPQVSSDTHPDPESWYPNSGILFKIVPPPGGEDRKYLVVFDESPDTVPDPKSAEQVSPGECRQSADHSGEWYMHVSAVSGDGEITSEPVHFRARVDVGVPPPAVVTSSTHLPSPRRSRGREAVLAWSEPDDVSGIQEYRYLLARSSILNRMEQRGVTVERSVSLSGLEPGVWEFALTAVDRAGQVGAPARYTMAIADEQDLCILAKSESWRVNQSGVEVHVNKDDKTVKKGKTDGTGAVWFKDLSYGTYVVSVAAERGKPALEFEGVAVEDGEQTIQLVVSMAGCAWTICRRELRLWVPELWLDGGRIELVRPDGKGPAVAVHRLDQLRKTGPCLVCDLPDDLLEGAFQLMGGALNKLQWAPIPFTRLPL